MSEADALFTAHSWSGIAGVFVTGVVFGALGLILATNWRGITTWHVRATFRFMRPAERALRRVPPWRKILAASAEERRA